MASEDCVGIYEPEPLTRVLPIDRVGHLRKHGVEVGDEIVDLHAQGFMKVSPVPRLMGKVMAGLPVVERRVVAAVRNSIEESWLAR